MGVRLSLNLCVVRFVNVLRYSSSQIVLNVLLLSLLRLKKKKHTERISLHVRCVVVYNG